MFSIKNLLKDRRYLWSDIWKKSDLVDDIWKKSDLVDQSFLQLWNIVSHSLQGDLIDD